MTLETLIIFLTIENNNINNYIVTFEKRVMVTAFAILAMFRLSPIHNGGLNDFLHDLRLNRLVFCHTKGRHVYMLTEKYFSKKQ